MTARAVHLADVALLERTLGLAELGRAAARPNPVVGAVLARPSTGVVLASGHHARCGEWHAERACLEAVEGTVPADATLYVSLEPCAHAGRQPPCAPLLIERGVQRVVYASRDPNPATAGEGPRLLHAAGVEVLLGPASLERQALQQNAGFHSVHLRERSYVTAKWAATRNGRVATGDSSRRWISGPESREFVHYLRAGSGAVAIGVGTAIADDPALTVRGPLEERIVAQPLRVVFDRTLRLPLASRLASTACDVPVLVVCEAGADEERETALRASGADVWRAPPRAAGSRSESSILAALRELARRGVNDVLLEAGPDLLAAFSAADLVDAVIAFVAPFDAPAAQPGLALDHPLVRAALAEPGTASGEDVRHVAVLHPAWELDREPDREPE